MINKVSKDDLGRFRHFILYAKGHYGNIYDNYMQKLKAIHAYSTGISYSQSNIGDLKLILLNILQDCYQEPTLIRKLRKMTLLNKERFLKQCISDLATLRTKKDGETYIELGEINPKLKGILGYIDELNQPTKMEIKPVCHNNGDFYWDIDFTNLFGCSSSGETFNKAIENAHDAKKKWIESKISKEIKDIF